MFNSVYRWRQRYTPRCFRFVTSCCLSVGLLLSGAGGAHALDAAQATVAPLRFGILPIGSAAESLAQWRPLLDDLQKRLGHRVETVSVSSYSALSAAIGKQRVDVAFLSGRLAVEVVTKQHMSVFAQFLRNDGVAGNTAMLAVRKDSPIHTIDDLLGSPGRWRYARSERMSVTGYIAPEAQVFAPRG